MLAYVDEMMMMMMQLIALFINNRLMKFYSVDVFAVALEIYGKLGQGGKQRANLI
jgi:hypothetical protein